jgi:hypothetical protein
MLTGIPKAAGLAISLAMASLALAACGSDGGDASAGQPPPLSAVTAGRLAKLSDRVASDLDSGDTCHAAQAADELHAAVEDAHIAASIRPAVESVAGRLVDEVNCPPPPAPAPEPEKKPKPKPEDHGNGNDHGDQHFVPPGQAKHGGFGPPGHEKLQGEVE